MQALLRRVVVAPRAWANAPPRRSKFTFSNSESGGAEAFFEEGRGPDPTKGDYCGRSWRSEELRLKSWDDLHKLWYVLYKEKNMLLSQVLMLKSQNIKIAARERIDKVKLSMHRLKQVLSERALAEKDRRRRNVLKKLINGR